MATRKLDVASLAQRVNLNDGILVLRPKAHEMLSISISELGLPLPGDIVLCNLGGIIDCSSSFVDEFVLGWQRLIDQTDNTMLILTNMDPDVQYTVESAIIQRNRISNGNFSVLAITDQGYEILGNKLEKNVLQVFDLIVKSEHTSVREVASSFNLELNSAGNRLKKLYDAHIVLRREQAPDAGGKFEYFLPNDK